MFAMSFSLGEAAKSSAGFIVSAAIIETCFRAVPRRCSV